MNSEEGVDFAAAFAVGEDNTHINTVDAGGVALAAIQRLHQLVQEKEARIAALEARLMALEQTVQVQSAAAPPSASAERKDGNGGPRLR